MRSKRAMNRATPLSVETLDGGMVQAGARWAVAAFVGGMVLAGCSSAPSESEMNAAFERQMAAQRKALASFVGKPAADAASDMGIKLKSLHKIGCKEDGEKAYLCDLEIEVTMMGETIKKVTSARFVKTSDGWSVAQ